jgi:hypothetical protein
MPSWWRLSVYNIENLTLGQPIENSDENDTTQRKNRNHQTILSISPACGDTAVWETFFSLISPFWLVASKLYSPN